MKHRSSRSRDDFLDSNTRKTDDAVTALITDPVMKKRLAKYLTLKCFRNSALEDMPAGIVPASKSSDYTDVVVRTPFGEIPWNDLSRFDDAEMKTLMVDVVNKALIIIPAKTEYRAC